MDAYLQEVNGQQAQSPFDSHALNSESSQMGANRFGNNEKSSRALENENILPSIQIGEAGGAPGSNPKCGATNGDESSTGRSRRPESSGTENGNERSDRLSDLFKNIETENPDSQDELPRKTPFNGKKQASTMEQTPLPSRTPVLPDETKETLPDKILKK